MCDTEYYKTMHTVTISINLKLREVLFLPNNNKATTTNSLNTQIYIVTWLGLNILVHITVN